MTKRKKPYWEMNARELAAATRRFDDPDHNPPARKPGRKQLAQLRQWQRKRAARRATLAISLDQTLITQADDYAADHGLTFSDLVSDALRQLLRKKSA